MGNHHLDGDKDMMDFNPDIDYNADIATYRRTRERLCEARGDPKVEAMIRDVDYVLEWLETGRRPGNKRGIERRAGYQREIPTEPDIIQAMVRNTERLTRRMKDNDYNRIIQVMAILSKRERECYEMRAVGQLSEYDIADELGIKRETVREYLERAERKITNFIKKPMQTALDIVV